LTGSVDTMRGDPHIIESADRTPFEWDADLVSLQEGSEMYWLPNENRYRYSAYDLFDMFVTEAEAKSSARWSPSYGMSENTYFLEGYAAMMLSSALWPRSSEPNSMWWQHA